MSMPDWKNLDDYNYTKKLDGSGWAWEFLRRNKDFIADYNAYKSGHLTDEFGNFPVSFKGTQLNSLKGLYFLKPALENGGTAKNWIKKHLLNNDSSKLITPEHFLARKWGLDRVVPDPSENALEIKIDIKFQEAYPFPKILRFLEDIAKVPLEDTSGFDNNENGECPAEFRRDKLILEFTLTEAFQPQIDRIEAQWKSLHKSYASNPLSFKNIPTNKNKPHKNILMRKLRVLDADIQGPKVSDVEKRESIYRDDPSGNTPETHYRDRNEIVKKANKNGYLELARISA